MLSHHLNMHSLTGSLFPTTGAVQMTRGSSTSCQMR
jgi:hypothetical protein